MLKSQMPHALITTANPVFDYELRHVGWPRSVDDLKRYSLYVLIALHTVLGAGWLLGRLSYSPLGLWATILTYTAIVAASIVITIVADVYYMLMSIGAFSQQIGSGQWDLLRITQLREQDILLAEYAIAQIRAWRLMSLELGIRIAGLVFAALFNLQLVVILLVTLPVSIYLAILLVGYIAEPLWRMQAMVALGGAIAARIPNHTFAILAALGTILVVQILRVIILAIPWYAALTVFTSRYSIFCMLPLASIAATYVLYTFYRTLQKVSLRYATRCATRTG
jgi:hypothetical protein